MNILIAGDFSPKYRVSAMFQKGIAHSLFVNVSDIIKRADYSIVNFETVVTDNTDVPISKVGPNLHCGKEAVHELKAAGFDCLTLANNHFRDYGDSAIKKSIIEFSKIEIDYVGGGINLAEAQKVLYKSFGDFKLAIVNVCESEFSIATETRCGCAPIDTYENYHQIKNAKDNADKLLLIVHGGCEHFQYPTPRMKKLYRYFVEIGADVVVNHHQHCYSGYEVYKGCPIFYGLGNFCFDNPNQRQSNWNKGFLLNLSIDKYHCDFDLLPYSQCEDNPAISFFEGQDREDFNKSIQEINLVIQDEDMLAVKMQEFMIHKNRAIIGAFSPYSFDYARAAAGKNYLPTFMSKSRALSMYNYIACESQRECTLNYLADYLKDKL